MTARLPLLHNLYGNDILLVADALIAFFPYGGRFLLYYKEIKITKKAETE